MKEWLFREGERVKTYDIFMRVSTNELVTAGYNMGSFKDETTLLVETQDDIRLLKIFSEENEIVRVGTPLALACDEEDFPRLQGVDVLHMEDIQHRLVNMRNQEDIDLTMGPDELVSWQAFME